MVEQAYAFLTCGALPAELQYLAHTSCHHRAASWSASTRTGTRTDASTSTSRRRRPLVAGTALGLFDRFSVRETERRRLSQPFVAFWDVEVLETRPSTGSCTHAILLREVVLVPLLVLELLGFVVRREGSTVHRQRVSIQRSRALCHSNRTYL